LRQAATRELCPPYQGFHARAGRSQDIYDANTERLPFAFTTAIRLDSHAFRQNRFASLYWTVISILTLHYGAEQCRLL